MIGTIVTFLTRLLVGGSTGGLAEQLRQAYEAKLQAENSIVRAQAEHDIKRIEAAIEVAKVANEDRWSATSLGRYLIVVPFGLWYSAIILDSIFIFQWDVLALPERVMRLSEWLVPAVIVGDAGRTIFRRLAR